MSASELSIALPDMDVTGRRCNRQWREMELASFGASRSACCQCKRCSATVCGQRVLCVDRWQQGCGPPIDANACGRGVATDHAADEGSSVRHDRPAIWHSFGLSIADFGLSGARTHFSIRNSRSPIRNELRCRPALRRKQLEHRSGSKVHRRDGSCRSGRIETAVRLPSERRFIRPRISWNGIGKLTRYRRVVARMGPVVTATGVGVDPALRYRFIGGNYLAPLLQGNCTSLQRRCGSTNPLHGGHPSFV